MRWPRLEVLLPGPFPGRLKASIYIQIKVITWQVSNGAGNWSGSFDEQPRAQFRRLARLIENPLRRRFPLLGCRPVGIVLGQGRGRRTLTGSLRFAQFRKQLRRTPAPPMAFLFDSLQAQDRSIQIIQLSTQLNQYFR